MSAQDHLSPEQFPIEQIHDMYSADFDNKMRGVRSDMRAGYGQALATDAPALYGHPKDVKYGGPDNYINHLATDVKKRGVVEPILIRGGNVVVEGHHRYAAAVQAGLTHVPVRHLR